MARSLDELLAEASDPTTHLSRLRQLSERKRKNERTQIRAALSSNPNSDLALLSVLSAEFPSDVLNNPTLEFLQFAEPGAWQDFPLKGLLAMLLSYGNQPPSQLLLATKSKLSEALQQAETFVDVTAKEDWHFQRTVVINPADVMGLIPDPVELDVTLVDHMATSVQLELECANLIQQENCESLACLLRLIGDADISGIVDSPLNSGGDDFSMGKPEHREELVTCSDEQIYFKKNSLYRRGKRSPLFSFWFTIHDGSDDEPVDYQDGILSISIGDKHFSIESSGFHLDPLDLGELGTLWGWNPPVIPSGVTASTWPEWLAHALHRES